MHKNILATAVEVCVHVHACEVMCIHVNCYVCVCVCAYACLRTNAQRVRLRVYVCA